MGADHAWVENGFLAFLAALNEEVARIELLTILEFGANHVSAGRRIVIR